MGADYKMSGPGPQPGGSRQVKEGSLGRSIRTERRQGVSPELS